MADNKRLHRPHLERDRPIRTWSTMFQSTRNVKAPTAAAGRGPEQHGAPPAAAAPLAGDGISNGAPLADAVEGGYRVINEYMRQGQTFAQGFNPGSWMNAGQTAAPADMQQIAQRVMQYGWDFAGLWFEMWTRMAGNGGGWPAPSGSSQSGPFARTVPATPMGPTPFPPPTPKEPAPQETEPKRLRLAVSVNSNRRTTTTLDIRPGQVTRLVIHALRAEGFDAPVIRDVTVESSSEEGAVKVTVGVPESQPPGVYNAMIVDGSSNLPRGMLSLTIHDEPKD